MYEDLTKIVQETLAERFQVSNVKILWNFPRDAKKGDISCSLALQLGRTLGKHPKEIAEVLAQALTGHPRVERVSVAGSGYVNVWLTADALLAGLHETRRACTARVARAKTSPVIVEYSQPNIAKPLGVHHLLSTIIGQTIANLYRHAGYDTISWNYLGDWGTQFGNLVVALRRWGSKPPKECTLDELLALYVRFHKEAERDAELEDEGREAFHRLEQGDPALREIWDDVVSITKASLSRIYERLHVAFDVGIGESFYQDKMDAVLKEGKKKKVFVAGEEGALVVCFSPSSGLPPLMVQKSDGATLYATRDLAQMRYRIDAFHPQKILILTDSAQKLYFQQIVAASQALGWEFSPFEHVYFGRMRFADRSMSTRRGTVLKLEEVLDEAVQRAERVLEKHQKTSRLHDDSDLAEMMGVGALAYGILSQNRKMDIVFDWDKMLSFEGNSAPYLQYTHARAHSVLDRSASSMEHCSVASSIDLSERERMLMSVLLEFPLILEEARVSHMPHKLTNYLYALCQEYNAFYNAEPILQAQEPHRSLRLFLTSSAASVLKAGAELLTLRIPDRM